MEEELKDINIKKQRKSFPYFYISELSPYLHIYSVISDLLKSGTAFSLERAHNFLVKIPINTRNMIASTFICDIPNIYQLEGLSYEEIMKKENNWKDAVFTLLDSGVNPEYIYENQFVLPYLWIYYDDRKNYRNNINREYMRTIEELVEISWRDERKKKIYETIPSFPEEIVNLTAEMGMKRKSRRKKSARRRKSRK